jgi:transposase
MGRDTEEAPGFLTHHEAHQEAADEAPFGSRGRGRVEVLSGGYRRRRWTPAEKARITQESFEPAARTADVARRNGVSEGVLYQWRKIAREAGGGGPTFIPVRLDESKPGLVTATGLVEIEVSGATIRLNELVDTEWLRAVVTAVRRK